MSPNRPQQYLDTRDKSSTGNLIKHVKQCWGDEVWKTASQCKDACEADAAVIQLFTKSRNITANFQRTGKRTISYMHQHTRTETKYIDSPIVTTQLTTIPGLKLFNGLQKAVAHLRSLKTAGFLI